MKYFDVARLVAPAKVGERSELFVVERSDGEWISAADGCDYSVFTSLAEAQDCLDTEADSGDPDDTYEIIRFSRHASAVSREKEKEL